MTRYAALALLLTACNMPVPPALDGGAGAGDAAVVRDSCGALFNAYTTVQGALGCPLTPPSAFQCPWMVDVNEDVLYACEERLYAEPAPTCAEIDARIAGCM